MWFTIANLLEQKLCFERTKTGCCRHINKRGKLKGKNPCTYTQRMINACSDGFSSASPAEVIEHLESKRCRNRGCNHRSCAEIDNALRNVDLREAA